jgi:hypothetical protein
MTVQDQTQNNQGPAETASPLHSLITENEVTLDDITLGPNLTLLPIRERLMHLEMELSRAIDDKEFSFPPTVKMMESLSSSCEELAAARVAAEKKIDAMMASSADDGQVIAGAIGPVSPNMAHMHNEFIPDLSRYRTITPGTYSSANVPQSIRIALQDRSAYIPLVALTVTALHMFTTGQTLKTERVSRGDKKYTVPVLDTYVKMEEGMSKSDWLEGWRIFLELIKPSWPSDEFVLKRWHAELVQHYLFSTCFEVILQIDIEGRRMFYLDPERPINLTLESFSSRLSSIHVMHLVNVGSAAPLGQGSVSNGPDRRQGKLNGQHRGGQGPYTRPFPAGSRNAPSQGGCCAKCGGVGHVYQQCSAKITVGGHPVKTFYSNGALWVTGNPPSELCRLFNTTSCANRDPNHVRLHTCSLCLRPGHSAQACH